METSSQAPWPGGAALAMGCATILPAVTGEIGYFLRRPESYKSMASGERLLNRCQEPYTFMRNENLLQNSLSSISKVYKPLFEAVGDGSGGKSLEDVFYEHEVGPTGHGWLCPLLPRSGVNVFSRGL